MYQSSLVTMLTLHGMQQHQVRVAALFVDAGICTSMLAETLQAPWCLLMAKQLTDSAALQQTRCCTHNGLHRHDEKVEHIS
jgi:hypothetical protein